MKKVLALVLALLMILPVVVACGGPVEPEDTTPADTTPAGPGGDVTTPDGGTTITPVVDYEFDGEVKNYDTTIKVLAKSGDQPTNWGNYDIVYNEDSELVVTEIKNAIKKRNEKLEEDIVIQKLKLDSAKNTYEVLVNKGASEEEIGFAKIDYEVEQLEYDTLIERREHLVIKAPFDGKITYVGNVWNGASVRQNQTICTIVDTSRPSLAASDYRGVLKNIEFGTKVHINQGALADTTGKVVDSREVSVRWGFNDNPMNVMQYVIQCDEEVEFSDMGGIEVTFTTLRRDEAIIVPSDAVFETDEGYYVNVLIDGVKVQTTVTIGVISGDRTEILTGLEGGEKIII